MKGLIVLILLRKFFVSRTLHGNLVTIGCTWMSTSSDHFHVRLFIKLILSLSELATLWILGVV